MKFVTKQISKKVLSCILALAVILCSVTCVFSVFADSAEVYSVTYGSPAIPMFTGKAVDLNNIEVQFTNGGEYVPGDSIVWSLADGTDTAAVSIEKSHYLVANTTGIHKLTATADGYDPKNIYVVVNETEGDYDFYLAKEDLTQNAELTGWSFYEGTTKLDITYSGNVGSITGSDASGTNRVYRTHDGYFEFMNNPAGTYRYMVYNSDIIKDFADYTVSSSMATTGHVDRTGFITRGDFTDNTALLLYYRRGAGVNVAQMNSICMLGDANRGFHTLGIGGYKDFANGTEAYTEIGKYYYADSQQYDLSATVSGSDILVKFEDQTVFDSKEAVIRLGSSESDRTTDFKNAFAESGKTDAGLVGFVQYNAYAERTHLYSFSVKLNVTGAEDLPEFVVVPEDETPVVAVPYNVTYGSPAIPMFVDKAVDLDYINVQFTKDGDYVSGNSITWDYADSTDTTAVTFKNEHYLVANKTGIHTLTATANGSTKNIYVVVNNKDDYDFYLAKEDLTQNAELTNWSFYEDTTKLDITYNGSVGYISGTSASDTNRVYRYQNNGTSGYTELMNGNTYRYMVYNSDIIKDFADYTVTSSMAAYSVENWCWQGFLTRGDFDEGSALLLYYRQGFGFNAAALNSNCMRGETIRGYHSLGEGGYKEIIEGGDYYYGAGNSLKYTMSATVFGSDIKLKLNDGTVFDTTGTVYRYGSTEADYTTQFKNAFAESGKTDAGLVGFVAASGVRMYLYDFSVKLNVTSAEDLPTFVNPDAGGDSSVVPYNVSYASPAIPMFVGKAVDLNNINVQFINGGEYTSGDSITWAYADGTDKTAVTFKKGHYLVANKTGIHTLTATAGGSTKNIYVVVNELGNYDFHLVKENFAGGIDISEWDFYRINNSKGRFAKLDVGEDGYINDPAFTTDDWQNQAFSLSGGNLTLGVDSVNWQDTMYMIYKSAVLSDFADYTVTTKFVDQGNDYQWSASGFVVRADIGSSAEESKALQMFYRSHYGFNFMSLGSSISSNGYYSSENGFTAITQDTYDTTVMVSGSDMKYSMSKNGTEMFGFDSTKAMYMYDSETATSTEYTTYESDFASKGTITPGTVGFANINLNVVVDSLSVKLNVTGTDDVPTFVDPDADSSEPEPEPDVYIVRNGNPVIPMTAGTRISLENFAVQMDGYFPIADTLIWDINNATGISVENCYLNAYNRGVYTVEVSNGSATATIHIVVKSVDETEYVVFEKDYRSETTDVSEWVTTVIIEDETEYTGKTYSGNYINNNNFQYDWSSVNDHPKGFAPYNAEELENALSGSEVAVYTTLNNAVVAALSDYKVTAGIKAYPNYRGAVGVIGRAVNTDAGKYTIGSGAGFALEAGKGNYIYSSKFPKDGAFSVVGNTRTKITNAAALDYMYSTVDARQYMHRTFEISYNGDTATLTTPNGGTEVLSGVNTQAGTVGLVSYFKDNNADVPYASVPVLSDIKIVLNNVDLSNLPSEDIPSHTPSGLPSKTSPYVDNGNYTFTVDDTNMITAYNIVDSSIGYSEKVTIPGEYDSMSSIFRNSPQNTTLGEVVIGEGFRYIWDQAFYNNYFLDTVSFPTSLIKVGPNAFQNSGVTDISFPSGSKLTAIDNLAFANCYSLRSLELPEGLETIGDNAFQNAVSLTSVKIPASVTSIGASAFAGCTLLNEVYIYNAYTTIGDGAIPTGTTIYGIAGSTAQTYANNNGCTFVAIGDKYSHNISVNSVSAMPKKLFGFETTYTAVSNNNFVMNAEGSIVGLTKGSADFVCTVIGLDGNPTEITVTVTVGGYDANANNFATADFSVEKTDTVGTYKLTVNTLGLKHSTLKINGEFEYLDEVAVEGGLATGREYTFTCDDLFTLSIKGEFAADTEDYRTSMFALGATTENPNVSNAHKLKFVFRAPAIMPYGTTAQDGGVLRSDVTVGGNDVTFTAVGAFMIPKVLLKDTAVMPTLKDGFNVNSTKVKINNSNYEAANVVIKYISDLTLDYADFNSVLTNIADNMVNVDIVCVPYIVYENADGTVGVIYGEELIRNHEDINPLFHLTEEELTTSAFRLTTDARIEEIKNTTTSVSATGTAYYVSNSGSDSNNGKSQSAAIATIDAVNDLSLKSGDVVYFERGGVWRGQVVAVKGVTYSAYGTGAKPEIWASPANYAKTGSWSEVATNIYRYSGTISEDVGTIVFDGGTAHGIKAVVGDGINITTGKEFSGYANLDTDLHFYHGTDGYVYLYSTGGNPAERWNDIEFSINKAIFAVGKGSSSLTNPDNVTIDNITMRYCGGHSVNAYSCSGLTVQNCEFYWIGGSIQDGTTRYGNGVEIWGDAEDFTVTGCYFYQIYDAAVTFQWQTTSLFSTTASAVDIKFTNNVMEYCNYSVEYFLTNYDASKGEIKNVEISGNHMWYAGYGLCSQRAEKGYDAHIKSWDHANPAISNFVIKNNVFAVARSYLCETLTRDSGSEAITYDGNTYIQYNGGVLGRNGLNTEAQFVVFDSNARETISSVLGDTNATIAWVEK